MMQVSLGEGDDCNVSKTGWRLLQGSDPTSGACIQQSEPIVLQLQPGMIRSGVACTPSPSGLADLGCEAMIVSELGRLGYASLS